MQIKNGVIMAGLRLPMRRVLIEAEKILLLMDKELVITSALDGTHSPGSLHYYGYALDLRTRHLEDKEVEKFADNLFQRLSSNYRVIRHSTHLHVEYRGKIDGSLST